MPYEPLAELLAAALRWCLAHPGASSKRQIDLRGGLTIVLYVDGGHRRHVLLSRRGAVGPSAREAQTVLEQWPEPVAEHVEWIASRQGKFSVLIGMWSGAARQLELGEEHRNEIG